MPVVARPGIAGLIRRTGRRGSRSQPLAAENHLTADSEPSVKSPTTPCLASPCRRIAQKNLANKVPARLHLGGAHDRRRHRRNPCRRCPSCIPGVYQTGKARGGAAGRIWLPHGGYRSVPSRGANSGGRQCLGVRVDDVAFTVCAKRHDKRRWSHHRDRTSNRAGRGRQGCDVLSGGRVGYSAYIRLGLASHSTLGVWFSWPRHHPRTKLLADVLSRAVNMGVRHCG